ncbi:MAG TPA: Asp-tRNA(Asn)/Glu-tRNA(Gln) amidotransferase subunit GatC [Hanamia sp.]|nr:Asp-tRNA(Asn)/Glu-tRNA(Gln) amidotransferase subunit GatC [Hanamia sp.]
MEVNDSLIQKLANLSRLEFNEEEKQEIKIELEKMIGFIDKLNELDTKGVEPLLHISENINIFRKDEVKGEVSKDDVFKNAPLHDDEFFKVPKVIKKIS